MWYSVTHATRPVARLAYAHKTMLVVDGPEKKLRDPSDVQFVDKLLALKKAGKHWEAIDEIVSYWRGKNPKRYRSFLIDVAAKRGTRATEYGSNRSKTVRSLLDIPEDVMYTIRRLYPTDQLEMDKKFYLEVYKRYPDWRVAERI